VREAKGQLFLPLDSDDECVPHALERFQYHWEDIPSQRRSRFSAVTALCTDQHGKLIGRPFPAPVVDSNSLEIHYRLHVTGEKWGFHRTDVLREYPFPDIDTVYVPESIVWGRIARHYATRFVNEVLRIYHTGSPSLMFGRAAGTNAMGGRLQHLTVLNEHLDYLSDAPRDFVVSAANYARFSFHTGVRITDQLGDIATKRGRLLWSLAVPLGWVLYQRDVGRASRQTTSSHA
jgi:hypothetical protein